MGGEKMIYTTISISKELKKQILITKAVNDKETLEDLLTEMLEIYEKQKKVVSNDNNRYEGNNQKI